MTAAEARTLTTLTGAAGEHFVMYYLLSKGFIEALAPQGAPNLDIVVSDIEGRSQLGLQVKTRRGIGSDGGWHMNAKHEEIASDTLFYSFVDFGVAEGTAPTLYVVPSRVVARFFRNLHSEWLSIPGKNGRARKDSSMRRVVPDATRYAPSMTDFGTGWLEQYKNAVDLLR